MPNMPSRSSRLRRTSSSRSTSTGCQAASPGGRQYCRPSRVTRSCAGKAGATIASAITDLSDRHGLVLGGRGRGLLQAVTLTEPRAPAVVGAALDAGLVVNAVAPDAVRLAPPLIVSDEELEQLVARLDTAFTAVGRGAPA